MISTRELIGGWLERDRGRCSGVSKWARVAGSCAAEFSRFPLRGEVSRNHSPPRFEIEKWLTPDGTVVAIMVEELTRLMPPVNPTRRVG